MCIESEPPGVQSDSHDVHDTSDPHNVNVSIRELLALVGESAAIPPSVPVNQSCVPEALTK